MNASSTGGHDAGGGPRDPWPAPDVPTFGRAVPDETYVDRPGSYVLIRDPEGRLAIVRTAEGFYLPGGGAEAGESAEDAALREAREECGFVIEVSMSIGVAEQRVHARSESAYYRKRCTFFLAVVRDHVAPLEADHTVLWLAPAEAREKLTDESQAWAVERLVSGERGTFLGASRIARRETPGAP